MVFGLCCCHWGALAWAGKGKTRRREERSVEEELEVIIELSRMIYGLLALARALCETDGTRI